MARTVNETVYRVRRDAFLDAAQRLITTKGYDEMSIQDVLDAVDTSRGAFYHYFDSKHELLEAVIERFADTVMGELQPLLDDSSQPALRRLEHFLHGVAGFKAESRELMLAVIRVWSSDGNVRVREKNRRLSAAKLRPILGQVIAEGVREGSISVGHPDEAATVLTTLMLGYQELATEQFLARQAGTITFETVQQTYSAFVEAFERILGIPPGSVNLTEESTLRLWFG